jgi:hypothetical protein
MDNRIEKITLAFSLGLPCAASLGLMLWAPGRVTPTTFAVVVALLLGTATVALNTWKSAQATGSVGQLIYETDRGAQKADNGGRRRLLTMMVMSVVATALIASAWLV